MAVTGDETIDKASDAELETLVERHERHRFDELLEKTEAERIDDRDILLGLYLIGITLEELRDAIRAANDRLASAPAQ